MTPGTYDIKIQKGATFSNSIQATDDSGALNFGVMYTRAELAVWPSWVVQKGISGLPLLTLTTESGHITLAGEVLTLQMDLTETGALAFKEGAYELKLINTGVTPTVADKLLFGKFLVKGL
jgi:hypothetical protein